MPNRDPKTARQNGARSQGPKTETGKQNSAKNSYKRGIYATKLLLWGDDEATFQALEKDLRNRYNPQGEMEETLFYQLLAALWRLRQIPAADVSMVNIQMQRMAAATDAQFEALSPQGRYALAFNALAPFGDGPARLARQERRLFRQYHHYRQELEHLQATRPEPDPPSQPCNGDPTAFNPVRQHGEPEPPPPEIQNHKSDETNPAQLPAHDTPTNPDSSLYAYLPPIHPKTPPTKEVAQAATSAS